MFTSEPENQTSIKDILELTSRQPGLTCDSLRGGTFCWNPSATGPSDGGCCCHCADN